jgi:hypothetical protein
LEERLWVSPRIFGQLLRKKVSDSVVTNFYICGV